MRIFGVIPLSSYKTALKQQLNGEKWYVDLGHLPAFGRCVLFSFPVGWKNVGKDIHCVVFPY